MEGYVRPLRIWGEGSEFPLRKYDSGVTKPGVAEQLMLLAANYLELAERALKLRQPAIVLRLSEIQSRKPQASKAAQSEHPLLWKINTPERNS
jgi:hypothetical protein